jgi:hypothetical protein
MGDYLNWFNAFLNTQTPFMLMFVALFFYVIKTNRDREIFERVDFKTKLDKIDEEIQVIIKVWKILLEKELEARK